MRAAPILILLAACQSDRVESAPAAQSAPAEATMTEPGSFSLSSDAFNEGAKIPAELTADGADLSPPLSWSGIPEGTKSFALIMDDPDAPVGTWDHWIVYDLPADTTSLARGASKALPEGARDGTNSWGRTGYGGPAPPPGKPHRYFFKLYALKEPLGLAPGAKKGAVEAAMEGKILGEATWMGTYQR